MHDLNDELDNSSLERIVPDEMESDGATGDETLRLHLERYSFAKKHLIRGKVLDLACGVGYGAALLAQNDCVASVLGVDLSCPVIQYANDRYANDRVSYLCSEALQFSPGLQFEN